VTSKSEHDQVLMDYLGTLLQDDVDTNLAPSSTVDSGTSSDEINNGVSQISYPLTGIRARVSDQNILLPIEQLAGMQALTGPLVSSAMLEAEWPSWKVNLHAELALLDVSAALRTEMPAYSSGQWRGHLLKLKQQACGVLVDEIMGPSSVQESEVAQVHLLVANIPLLLLRKS